MLDPCCVDVATEADLMMLRWLEADTKRLDEVNQGLLTRIADMRAELADLRGQAARLSQGSGACVTAPSRS